MHTIDAQRIRITLAFIALKRKPKDTSLAAYVLDLRDQFSSITNWKAVPDEPWRERALKLEGEVDNLKRKYTEDLAELDSLREKARSVDHTNFRAAQSPSSKKRRKLNAAVGNHGGNEICAAFPAEIIQDHSSSLAGLKADKTSPELNGALRLFSSYYKLSQISSALRFQPARSINPSQLLFSATDVLRALARALQTTISPQHRLKVSLTFINDFTLILCSTVSRVMSILPLGGADPGKKQSGSNSTAYDLESLEVFFTTLASDVILPFVKAFSRLSLDALVPVLSKTKQQKEGYTDVYGTNKHLCKATLHGVLMIIRGVMAIVGKSTTVLGTQFIDVIKLSAVTEIERLWTSSDGALSGVNDNSVSVTTITSSTDSCIQPVAKFNRHERVRYLVRKAALWHLCAITHDAFSSVQRLRSNAPTFNAAHDKLDIILSRLLVRCSNPAYMVSRLDSKGTAKMCDVEKGMIVSVIESIWLAE